MTKSTDMAEYIIDHYGLCTSDQCSCLKSGWIGRLCKNWVPVKSKNWDELLEEVRNRM